MISNDFCDSVGDLKGAGVGGLIPSLVTNTFKNKLNLFTKENYLEPIPDPWRQQWQANLIK